MSSSTAFDRNASRAERYDQLDLQCGPLLEDMDAVANQANFAAIVHAAFGWHWVGFYRVVGEELVLGPSTVKITTQKTAPKIKIMA